MRRPEESGSARTLAVVGFALTFGWGAGLALLRHASVHARSLDQAYYVRLVWGLGRGLRDLPVVGAADALGLHLEPILWPLAWATRALPAGWLGPTLLVVQAAAAAAAVFPALRLARRHLAPTCGEAAAGLVAWAAVLVPTVTRNVDYDFHPITCALAPLLYLCDALDERRWARVFAWAVVCLGFREDVGLSLAALGLAAATRRDARAPGLALATLGIAWFLGYALGVQPGRLPAVGSYDAHFAELGVAGGGVGGVLRAAVADPARLARLLVAGDRPWSLVLAFAQVGFLSLGAPRLAAGALPILGINLLSSLPGVRAIQAHYATGAAPFLVASAIVGAGALAARLPTATLRRVPAAFLLAAAATSWWARGASPGSPEWRASAYRDDDHARKARALAAVLPAEVPVLAPSRLAARLAERADVRRIP